MKKISIVIILLLALLALAGCEGRGVAEPDLDPDYDYENEIYVDNIMARYPYFNLPTIEGDYDFQVWHLDGAGITRAILGHLFVHGTSMGRRGRGCGNIQMS